MKTCLVIGASNDFYWDKRIEPDYVICADGGSRHAEKNNLRADLIIGDFDSCKIPDASSEYITLPKEKDSSDLEACLDHALGLGLSDFYLTGCTGGRLDHFMANVFLLEYLRDRSACGRIIDRQNEIFLCDGVAELSPPHRYKYFSVIVLDRCITDIEIKNAKYPLSRKVLYRGTSLTLSNEALPNETAYISLSGSALIILSK